MKTTRIHRLVEVIPPSINLFAGAHGVQPLQESWDCLEIHRLARALYDPAFAWAYAVAFAEAKMPLPALVNESSILEAYRFLRYGPCSDSLRGALVLREEPLKLKRGLLEALLLVAPALPIERLGELTGESKEAVQLYVLGPRSLDHL